jgi:hypothetical protein
MSQLTAVALRIGASKTYGLYRKIAADRMFAIRLASAIRRVDLAEVERLFRKAAPGYNTFSVNSFTFIIGFPAPQPADEIFNDTSLQGGGTLAAADLRGLSKLVLPLYAKLACNKAFTRKIVQAARAGDSDRLRRLIVPLIPARKLVSVRGSSQDLSLRIRLDNGVIFLNEFFVL